jgi:putative peptidoglycan lipid II flippase
VIGVPLGVVLLPTLSREAATGNVDAFTGLVERAIRVIVFVMVPVAGLLAIVRVEFVALLFGRFDAGAIELTASTLLTFSIGLVAHSLIAVLARAFYARQDTVRPVGAAVTAVAVNTTFAAILVGPLGLPGIALAIAIAAWIEAGILIVLLGRRVTGIGLGRVGSVAARTVIASLVAGAIALGTKTVVAAAVLPDPVIGGLLQLPGLITTLVVTSVVYGVILAGGAVVLRITELRSIVGIMIDALPRLRRA